MSGESLWFAGPKRPISALCGHRWIFWCWEILCWIKPDKNLWKTTRIGRNNSNWIKMKLLDEIKGIKSDKKSLREFGMTLGIFFGLLSAFLWWKGKSTCSYFAALSVFFLFFGFAAPALLKP